MPIFSTPKVSSGLLTTGGVSPFGEGVAMGDGEVVGEESSMGTGWGGGDKIFLNLS